MSWCEANRVDFLFGLAKNKRLVAEVADELAAAEEDSKATGQPWAFSPRVRPVGRRFDFCNVRFRARSFAERRTNGDVAPKAADRWATS